MIKMKLNENYVLKTVAGTPVVVPVGEAVNNIRGMITLNGPAELIWNALENGKDYEEIRQMKHRADELNISLLLVHHLRKQGDSDPFNKLTGTTGIVGAVDTAFVLDKSKRNANNATLYCTGRDVEDRQIEIQFSKKDFVWEVLRDSKENREMLLPKGMELLIDFMKVKKSFSGSNTEFSELYNEHTGQSLSAKTLKQMMNLWRYSLEEFGLSFLSHRSNGQRLLEVNFSPPIRDESDRSDV